MVYFKRNIHLAHRNNFFILLIDNPSHTIIDLFLKLQPLKPPFQKNTPKTQAKSMFLNVGYA